MRIKLLSLQPFKEPYFLEWEAENKIRFKTPVEVTLKLLSNEEELKRFLKSCLESVVENREARSALQNQIVKLITEGIEI